MKEERQVHVILLTRYKGHMPLTSIYIPESEYKALSQPQIERDPQSFGCREIKDSKTHPCRMLVSWDKYAEGEIIGLSEEDMTRLSDPELRSCVTEYTNPGKGKDRHIQPVNPGEWKVTGAVVQPLTEAEIKTLNKQKPPVPNKRHEPVRVRVTFPSFFKEKYYFHGSVAYQNGDVVVMDRCSAETFCAIRERSTTKWHKPQKYQFAVMEEIQ